MATTRHHFPENVGSRLPRQNAGAPALKRGVLGGATKGGRPALGELVNQQALPSRSLQPEGKQPVKPVRNAGAGLVRQRGVANLPNAVAEKAARPARKAAASAVAAIRHAANAGRKKSVEEPPQVVADEPMEMEATAKEDVEAMELDVPQPDFAVIEDVDKDDHGNPQLAVEYINEIYAYMRQLERRQYVKEDYLNVIANANPLVKVAIKPKMRNVLVDWLVDVHNQFNLIQEVLYLTVAIIDRYLQEKVASVTTKQLQLIGVTAMFIASKYEEVFPPEIGDFVYITDHAYTAGQIRKMEVEIIAALRFDLGRPLPIHFLRRASKAAMIDGMIHSLAKYAMELSIIDYNMAHIHPSIVAAASLAFAMRVQEGEDRTVRELWTPTLAHYTSYAVEDFAPVLSAVAAGVKNATEALDAKMADGAKKKVGGVSAVANKYMNKKFLKVSLLPEVRSSVVASMANNPRAVNV